MMPSGLTIPDRGAREQAEAATTATTTAAAFSTAEGQGKVTVIDVKRERDHLAQANRHVARAHKHIAEQKRLIEELVRGGHDIDVADAPRPGASPPCFRAASRIHHEAAER